MTLRIKRQLRLRPVEQFTDPDPRMLANRAALKAHLMARGYDDEHAERLSALATRTDCWMAFDGVGATRDQLPGGAR